MTATGNCNTDSPYIFLRSSKNRRTDTTPSFYIPHAGLWTFRKMPLKSARFYVLRLSTNLFLISFPCVSNLGHSWVFFWLSSKHIAVSSLTFWSHGLASPAQCDNRNLPATVADNGIYNGRSAYDLKANTEAQQWI